MGTSLQFNAAIASLMLFLIAFVHLYWALGGKKGLELAVPSENGKPLFDPGRAMIFGMAIVLLEAAAVQVGVAVPDLQLLPLELHKLVGGVFGIIFLGRGLGGWLIFTILPFFRDSAFARWDRTLYSPVCVYLGLSFLWICLSA